MPELINWYMEKCSDRSTVRIAHGIVFGSPKFRDGQSIHTSGIQEIVREGDILKIQTQNSVYEGSLAMHLLTKEAYKDLYGALKTYGYSWQDAETLVRRMWDAYFPLGKKKKKLLQSLFPEKYGTCNILEFSGQTKHYFRFLARRDPDGNRFWDQGSLHVTPGRCGEMAELHDEALQKQNINFRFYPRPDGLELDGCPAEYGAVLVRNGGLGPLEVKVGVHRYRIPAGECVELVERG